VTAPFVPDAEIRRIGRGRTYERGLGYARGSEVLRVLWDPRSTTIIGVVAGSEPQPYTCRIRLDVTGTAPRIMTAHCSCPVQQDCKHAVATLLRSNTDEAIDGSVAAPAGAHPPVLAAPDAGPHGALGGAPKAGPGRTEGHPTGWRRLLLSSGGGTAPLALGLELRVRESAQRAHWGPRRLHAATPREIGQGADDVLVGLRPLTRSDATGAWIRTGVSWDALRRLNDRHPRGQLRWFSELYGIAHDARLLGGLRDDSEWLSLDTVESRLLWPHLADAATHDIPVVPAAKHQSVAVVADATAELAVERAGTDGGLRLAPRITIAGERVDPAHVRPIGQVGLYSFAVERDRISLTLARAELSDAVRSLLTGPPQLDVPPADADEFLRAAYPRLARETVVTAGAGVELPVPEPTVLVATIAFERGDTLRYRLEWQRSGAGREPLDAVPAADPAESALRTAAAAAWLDTDLDFAPSATLTGVEAAEFGAKVLPALESIDGIRVEVSGKRRTYRELAGDPRITVSTVESTDPDWFDLGVIVEIDGRRIPFTPLFTALALRRKKLLLADGGYFSLRHPALDRLRELIDEAAELAEWEAGPKISRYQLPLWEDFEDLADESRPALAWRAAARALRDAAAADPVPPPSGLQAQLRPYQEEGYQRLALWWRHRLGGILADDMGLGKTIQVLALISHARETGERRPVLVVAPTSVLGTWRDEATRFAPGVRVQVVESTRTTPDPASADVIVTSYTLLRLEEARYAATDWAIVVLDEAQFVKNPRTRLHRAVQSLHAGMVLAVTGTPLENSLTELWALLSLTCPGLFPSPRKFREEYIKPIEQGKVPENAEGAPYRQRRLERLRHRIRPFVLRRTKELVAPELPPRQEQELRVELSPAHRAVYDLVLQRERQKVLGLLADLDRNRFIVFRSLTLLRRLALAPSLVDAGDDTIRSSKLDALRERIDELVAEGHRAIVFSQFTSYLDLVRADLEKHGVGYSYLDGSTRRRADVVREFRAGDAPVFLISLKAGGFGLTLTEADYVFLLDPWWNPAAEAQAVDRTHRIGQTRPVNVYRLIASGTIEEKVVALQQRKARLFRSVMDDDELLARSLTADDIRGLLES